MTAAWPSPDVLDDSALLQRAVAGDEDAFALLYHRHRGMVRSICVAQGPRGQADDLTSETFAKLVQHAERLRDRDRLGPWLATVARNTAISALRRPVVHREAPVADVPVRFAQADHAESVATRLDVDTLLDHVEGHDAAMLRAHYMDGRPLADIADEHGTSVGAIKVRLHRARGRVRRTAFARALRGLVPLPVLAWRGHLSQAMRVDPSAVAMVLAPAVVVAAIAGGIAARDDNAGSQPAAVSGATVRSMPPGAAANPALRPDVALPAIPEDKAPSTARPVTPREDRAPAEATPEADRPDMFDVPRVSISNEPPAPQPDSTVGVAGLEVETTSPPGVSDETREAACELVDVIPEPVSCHNER